MREIKKERKYETIGGQIKNKFRLKELFIREQKQPTAKVVSDNNILDDVEPEVTFDDLITLYEEIPQIQLAVNSFHVAVVGEDIEIKAEDPEIEKLLNDYKETYNLHQVISDLELNAEICGEALAERMKGTNEIITVDMASVTGIKFKTDQQNNSTGQVEGWIQELDTGNEQLLPSPKFMSLPFRKIRKGQWGRSMFYSLAVRRQTVRDDGTTVTTKSLAENLKLMEDAMTGIFINMSNPMMFVTYGDADQQFIDDISVEIQNMRPGDKIIGDRKPEIDIHEVNPTGKFDSYVKHIEEAFMMGTNYSYEIFLGSFTSRASSQTTETELDKAIQARKRTLSNWMTVNWWRPVLKQFRPDLTDQDILNQKIHTVFIDPNNVVMQPSDIKDADYMDNDEKRDWAKNAAGISLKDQPATPALPISPPPPSTTTTDPEEPMMMDLETAKRLLADEHYIVYRRKK